MMDIFLKVFLKSSAGEVELSTYDQGAPYRLLDGTRGFGLPQRSVESTPIPSGNGSVIRSQRFDESEMMLPISIRGANASDVAEKARELEHVLMPASNEPIELRVEAPQLSTTRRRFIYYMSGLEGAIGSQDSHWVWRHAQVTFTALDPMWYGQERVLTQRVDAARKPFITSRVSEPAPGAVVYRENYPPPEGDGQETVIGTNRFVNPNFNTTNVASRAGSLSLDGGWAKLTSTGGSTYVSQEFDVASGDWVAASVDVDWGDAGRARLQLQFYSADSSQLSTTHTVVDKSDLSDGGRISVVEQAPSGAASVRVYLWGYKEGAYTNLDSGQSFYTDKWMADVGGSESEAEELVSSYFDGDSSPSAGVDYRWLGEPNESASEKYNPGFREGDWWFVGKPRRDEEILATNLAANPTFENLAYQIGEGNITSRAGAAISLTNDWSDTGGTSLKVGGGSSWYTSAFIAMPGPGFVEQSRGKTYTASCVFHLEEEHDDTIRSASRRLTVNVQQGGSMQYEFAMSNKADRAAGTTERLVVTFTVPEDAVAWNITAFNGSQNSVSYWDSITIEEGSSASDYFDGDTENPSSKDKPHYRWADEPHASPSEKYLPATAFKPTDRYVHNGTEWEQVGLEKRAPFLPIVLASSTVDGAYQLNIQGDAEAWPIWEIDGPGEDLLIENVRTGERIFIEGEFGETVTIDTRPTIADIYSETEDDGQLWKRVDDDYDLFPLTPGKNRIKITMVNARPNSVVRLRYSETWLAGW